MTETSSDGHGDLVGRRTLILLIAIAIMSFSAVITLLAWAPDLARNDRAGAHPFSKSALGYGGLVKLLELRGDDVSISRTPQTFEQTEDRGLLVLTPGWRAARLDEDVYPTDPTLVILPKWWGETDRRNRRWQSNIDLKSEDIALQPMQDFDETATMTRIEPPESITTPYGTFDAQFEDQLQLISGEWLAPIISLENGDLLSRVMDTKIYILSDPDLANTFGLSKPENARLMLAILDNVRGAPDAPIVLDATMHGFERSTSLLKVLLDIPFIGATLTALAAMLLLGWTGLVRFGSPERESRTFALGKEALTDNTAGLFSMTRRETRMAPGYLALSRKAAVRDLGVPKGLSEADLNDLLDRMGEDSTSGLKWSDLARDLRRPAYSRDDLLDKAQRIYRWRKERNDGLK